MTDRDGRKPLSPLPIPENWEDLTHEEKVELVTELLTGLRDQVGATEDDSPEAPK